MDLYEVRKRLNMGESITNINLRVTDYARVSTDSDKQKKSLKNQVEHFENYIKQNVNWTYIKGYVDDGITGTSDVKRDNFMKMIEDARKGKFDLIVTKEISRFSRNTLDSIKYTRELLSYGVAVLFVNDNINTAMPDSELRLTIMASMAQDEIRRLSERVKFGMNRAIERGEILGNDLLLGYKKDKNTGNLIIINEDARIVRRIYELYAIDEISLSKIAKILNEEGLKTSLNKKWSVSGLSRIIENPKYKGYYCAKKSEVVDYMSKKIKYFEKDKWIIYEDNIKVPPIVSVDLWERANKRLLLRKKGFQKRGKEKDLYKDRYLYSAKIYCDKCNAVYHRRIFRKNNKDVTWVCSEYLKKGKKYCDTANIRESEINYILEDILLKLKINVNKVINILMSYYKSTKIDSDFEEVIICKQKELKSINLKKDKLLELNLQGIISNKEFYERNNMFNEKINKINDELEEIKNNSDKIKIANNYSELARFLKSKLSSKIVRNHIIKNLLNYISVIKVSDSKIKLMVYLNYKLDNKKRIFKGNYEFKRGYDTEGTKRYNITYEVEYKL